MGLTETILKPLGRSRAGANLPHFKNTAEQQTVIMPPPATVAIPLKQHIGAPCNCLVKPGDKVFVGTVIGDNEAAMCCPVHSSVSGTVKEISSLTTAAGDVDCVVIESDGEMTPEPSLTAPEVKTADDIIAAARSCGLVGLGGAGFPVHIKISAGTREDIDTLIINCAECEPYITADYRECMEAYDDIIEGLYLLREIFNFKKIIIGVEDNKPKAIAKLYEIAADHRDEDDTVKLMKLKSRYPQGAEKMLVYSATKRKIPAGKLPADVGCIVMNITTVSALYRYIKTGMPLVAKRVTVDGGGIATPQNVLVPIGTALKDIIEFCGGCSENTNKVLLGGPMMGVAVKETSSVVTKNTNAVLCLADEKSISTTPCIRCGRCAAACPMHLTPAAVEVAVNRNDISALNSLNVNMCIECGSCSFVCPASRPLTPAMRTAKFEMRRNSNGK